MVDLGAVGAGEAQDGRVGIAFDPIATFVNQVMVTTAQQAEVEHDGLAVVPVEAEVVRLGPVGEPVAAGEGAVLVA
ncbi:MAG TPA: hypothetical protein VGM93_11240, partial [Acidimicrobiales bacterium]